MNLDDATRPDGLRIALSQPEWPVAVSGSPWATPGAWDIPDVSPSDPDPGARPFALLVSFHYLRAAVRRRRWLLVVLTVLGMLLGVAYPFFAPAAHTATASVMLSHEAGQDPARAMETDLSLLTTRSVAQGVISKLSLSMTPDQLSQTVWNSPPTSELLTVNLSAPSDREAVRRLAVYTQVYLDFRASQISAQADFTIKGYHDRITALQSQVDELSARIQNLSAASGADAADKLTSAISQRVQLSGQIATLQNNAEDATLHRSAVIAASRVVDPAVPVKASVLKAVVLSAASGLIGGAFIGVVIVLMQALLSDRLRLRVEVASALETPVVLSIGRIGAPLLRQRLLRFLPLYRRQRRRRDVDLERAAHAVEQAFPEPGRRQRLLIGCIDNADDARYAVAAAALAMSARGRHIRVVDLTGSGGVAEAVSQLTSDRSSPEHVVVYRPRMEPLLAGDLDDLEQVGPVDPEQRVDHGSPLLVLADIDPAVGVHHFSNWTQTVLVAVSAGRSSVEQVRTAADLIRSADLEMNAAILIRAEPDDGSSGLRPRAPSGEIWEHPSATVEAQRSGDHDDFSGREHRISGGSAPRA